MDKYKETLVNIESGEFSINELVSILILVVSKIDIDTVSGMATTLGKTRRGIEKSKRFMKIFIGKQIFAINGLRESSLPF